MSKDMNEKVSIISAVYQVKPYLPQFLDSILAQSFRDWKLYLVDDGSTDGGSAVCDDYAQRDRVYRSFIKKIRALLCPGSMLWMSARENISILPTAMTGSSPICCNA